MSAAEPRVEVRSMFSELLIKSDERRSFLIALALVALARAQAASEFTYAVDDYRAFINGFDFLWRALIIEGRFGTYMLSEAFAMIGYDPMRAPIVTIVVSVFLSTWVANAVLRLWSYEIPQVLRVFLMVIIAAHPYTTEILTFRNIAIYHVLAFALAMAAMLLSRPTIWGLLISSVVFALALSLYQIPVNQISVFLCFDLALRILRQLSSREDVPAAYSLRDRSFYARILTFVLGFVLYFILLKLSTLGFPSHKNSSLVEFHEIPGRLIVGANLLYGHFVSGTAYTVALVPPVVLAILLLLVAAAVLELILRPKGRSKAALAIVIVVAAPIIAGFAMLGIPLLVKVMWLPPRVLATIGLVWAGVAVMTISVRRLIPQSILTATLGVVAFAFIVQNHQIFIDQARVATRDHNLAVRLISRLEDQPNFSDMKRVVVAGKRVDTGAPILSGMHGFNDSNFSHWWAIAPMLTELSGISIKPGGAPEMDEAKTHCQTQAPWPAPGAVVIRGELAIICL